MMMVEQNARRALAMSDRGYVLDLGKDRFDGPGQELLDDPKVAELYLGGTARIDEPDRRRSRPAARDEKRPETEAPAARTVCGALAPVATRVRSPESPPRPRLRSRARCP